MNALGLIEVSGVAAGIDCLDIMCKSANVEFVTWERKLGGRLVTVIVEGDVSAVTAAPPLLVKFPWSTTTQTTTASTNPAAVSPPSTKMKLLNTSSATSIRRLSKKNII